MDASAQSEDNHKLDTLDASGGFIQVRSRGDVHQKGFWHRNVHVWILDLSEELLLMQHRPPSHKVAAGMWTCCTGHVLMGEPSLAHAIKAVESDFKIVYPETSFEFLFSCKEITERSDITVKQMIDVYALALENAPKTNTLAIESDVADAVRYVSLPELEGVYAQEVADHVRSPNPEYPQRLFRAVAKLFRRYQDTFVRDDSGDERNNEKEATQMIDTLDESGVLGEPGRRGEVDRQSMWHRAVHVWVLDVSVGAVLLLQRSKKKRHFSLQWNCSSGRVKAGDPAFPAAVKSIKDDAGLVRLAESEFEFMFHARNEADTGGGCLLKQYVDVYCVTLPSDSYPSAPAVDTLQLARGEVDAAQYMAVDELERIWAEGKAAKPQFVIPSSEEYRQRLFYLLRQKLRKMNSGGSPGAAAITE
eukprot:CAMPEP_0170231178 /NCGR_PEP_ID=MMETSP0116_2-20130129/15322_1 /TAXON_ID=400756 /ORGANISM="Durinskia baltica, Strain CSIRO CS-38" /LENGTH=417 /DNA_ID=CAMNT_0010481947 /DNA_START=98 /DNA_END=1351 /DNA_ORIENTATION=+